MINKYQDCLAVTKNKEAAALICVASALGELTAALLQKPVALDSQDLTETIRSVGTKIADALEKGKAK